jgi:thymidylate kinase
MPTLSKPEGKKYNNLLKNCLTWLFNEYKKNNVAYCILRNYKHLPEKCSSQDIDILIDRKSLKKAENIIFRMTEHFDLNLLPLIRKEYLSRYTIFKINSNRIFHFTIEYFTDGECFAACYLKGEKILAERRTYKNFFIPHPVHEAMVSWLKTFLLTGNFKYKYKLFILETVRLYHQEFQNLLNEIFGKKMANTIWPLIKSGNIEKVSRYQKRMFNLILLKTIFANPLNFMKKFLILCYFELLLRLNPSGIIVAIIGPDGSGKSTTTKEIAKIFEKIYSFNEECHIYWRPGILPLLGDLFRLEKREFKGPCTNPHAAKPSGFLFSLMRLIYYTIDYIIGYPLKILPKIARNYMIIFDRYYYDFIIDPYRSRIKLPRFIPYLIMKFIIPKPDVVIYLDNNPDTLIKRKQEVPIEELERQLTEYRDLVSKLPNGYIINGDRPLEDIVHEAASLILNAKTIDNKHELSRIQ